MPEEASKCRKIPKFSQLIITNVANSISDAQSYNPFVPFSK
jgi:hypothetical protein